MDSIRPIRKAVCTYSQWFPAVQAPLALACDMAPLDTVSVHHLVFHRNCLDTERVCCHRCHRREPQFSVAESIQPFCPLSIFANAPPCGCPKRRPEILRSLILCRSVSRLVFRMLPRIRPLLFGAMPMPFPGWCRLFWILKWGEWN